MGDVVNFVGSDQAGHLMSFAGEVIHAARIDFTLRARGLQGDSPPAQPRGGAEPYPPVGPPELHPHADERASQERNITEPRGRARGRRPLGGLRAISGVVRRQVGSLMPMEPEHSKPANLS